MPKIKLQRLPYFFLTLAAFAGAAVGNARADDATDQAQADKWRYNLFNPTPDDQLRPLSVDANDGVIDPTTVDAGHVQLQGSLVDFYSYTQHYSFPPSAALALESYKYTEEEFEWDPRVTLGVWNDVDLFVHPYYRLQSYRYSEFMYGGGPATPVNASGNASRFENINVGTKVNLWGNDAGTTALAVAPYVSIPTDRGPVLAGADVAFAVRLPCQFYLKFDSNPYPIANGQQTTYLGIDNSMSLHRRFAGRFDAYAYLNTTWESRPGSSWYGYAGFGLAYQADRNLEIYGGIGFGLDDNAYDYNPRLGLAWRF
jgi:hypothetical protein